MKLPFIIIPAVVLGAATVQAQGIDGSPCPPTHYTCAPGVCCPK